MDTDKHRFKNRRSGRRPVFAARHLGRPTVAAVCDRRAFLLTPGSRRSQTATTSNRNFDILICNRSRQSPQRFFIRIHPWLRSWEGRRVAVPNYSRTRCRPISHKNYFAHDHFRFSSPPSRPSREKNPCSSVSIRG
jgi:hypothetical protein